MQHKPSSATASVTIKALIINPFKKSKPHHEKDCGWHNENPKHDLSSELAPGLMLLAVNTGSRLTAHELRRPLTTGLQSVQHLSLTPDAVLILAFSLRLSLVSLLPLQTTSSSCRSPTMGYYCTYVNMLHVLNWCHWGMINGHFTGLYI